MKVGRLFLNGNQKNELNREIPISRDTTLQRLYPLGVVMFERALGGMPQQPSDVSIEEFRGRQERVLSRLSHTDILIIASPQEKTRSNDVHYPFRTQSDLLYLCGWKDPESVLTCHYDGNKWITTLFVQPKNTLMEIWEGRRLGLEGAKELFAIDESYSIDDLERILKERMNDCKRVLLRTGFNSKIDDLVTTAIKSRTRDRQHFGKGPVSIEDPSAIIAELRLRKSKHEIAQMRHSAIISAKAHELAMRYTKNGIMEYQLQSIIESFFTYAGTSGWSYPSIVGCGENATILHYTVNSDQCNDGEIVLIDAGSEFRGYSADITRSWPISGKFTEAQKEIYNLVLDSQIAAINECRVGNPYNAPHDKARQVLAEGLIELGVINQSLEESLDPDTGDLKKWYMHNTGHWLGLDVHDVGVYKPNGEPRVFEEGMVLTVEPGLYFGAWRPDVECPEKYANIGIRIEDDILITKDGPDVLTKDCPKTVEEIESIVGSLVE